MPEQLKAAGGHLIDILGEVEGHWVVKYSNPDDAGSRGNHPWCVAKTNPNYAPYDLSEEAPRVGDVVAGAYSDWGKKYRVLGVDDHQMIVVYWESWDDGEWNPVGDKVQRDVGLEAGTMFFVRKLPDDYLRVVERP